MEFVKTSVFTREADKLLADEEQRELQKLLLAWPDRDDLTDQQRKTLRQLVEKEFK